MPESSIIPELPYPDVRKAVGWLCDRFFFVERLRIGNHRSQLTFQESSIVVTEKGDDSLVSQSIMVRVTGLQALFEHVKDKGVKVLNLPTECPNGERQFTVEDIAGHKWTFSETFADVDPGEWGGEVVEPKKIALVMDEEMLEKLWQKDQVAAHASLNGDEPYTLGPDSTKQPGVPRGELTQYHWKSDRIYPGTARDYWLYIPRQYDGTRPACLVVFQDGENYLDPEVNIPVVFDNLIHKQEIPVTIGLFINPGDKGPGNPIYGGSDNRSLEYDSLGDRYVRFLLEELLPEVEKRVKIVKDPAGRAICGFSSGGICAFTAAWERPDAFGVVVSHCGSFTDIRGGHNYPTLIRKTEVKPIRVFLQTGVRDLDVIFGNWPLANRDMAAALDYQGYDYRFVCGEGGHTLKHGSAIFPDTLRWFWRDYPEG